MTEPRPLYFFGTPTQQQTELLKAGKELLNPGFMVLPKRPDADSLGVALAFEHPDYCFIGGYAYVAKSDSPEKFANALAAVYGIRYTEYLVTPAQWLSRVLDVEVREVEE